MAKLKVGVPLPITGLDVGKPEEFIDPRSSPDCQNVEMSRYTLNKRMGKIEIGDPLGERIQRYAQLQIGSDFLPVRFGISKVQYLEQLTGVWTDIHHALLTGTIADLFDFCFPLIGGDKHLLFTNGIDPIRKWDGTGNDAELGGTPPLARFMTSYSDYVLLAYTVESGDTKYLRVRWCDTADPENWTVGSGSNAGFRDLNEDEQDITGIGVWGDYVTVHKDGAIYLGYKVSTSQVFRFDRKSTGVGTVAHATIASIPTGEQIFLARDGFHLFNGITAPLIESPIMDELRDSLNPEWSYKSVGIVVRERDEYWCAVPIGDQDEPITVYKYNYKTGQCYRDLHPDMTTFGLFQRIQKLTWDEKTSPWQADTTRWNDVIYLANNPTVIFGDEAGVSTRRLPVYSDNGVAIESYWISKDYTSQDAGDSEMGRMMRWQRIQIWAKGSEVTVEYSTDQGQSWFEIDTFTLTGSYPPDDAPIIGDFDVTSSMIRFRFSNDNDNETFTLKKFDMEAVPDEVRE